MAGSAGRLKRSGEVAALPPRTFCPVLDWFRTAGSKGGLFENGIYLPKRLSRGTSSKPCLSGTHCSNSQDSDQQEGNLPKIHATGVGVVSGCGDRLQRLEAWPRAMRTAEFPIRETKEAPFPGRCERGLCGVIMGVLPNCLKRRSAEADSLQQPPYCHYDQIVPLSIDGASDSALRIPSIQV